VSADLLIIVPTRGRPQSVSRVVEAWRDTDAFDVADLLFAIDADDPKIEEYRRELYGYAKSLKIKVRVSPTWRPMVPKLNSAALDHARFSSYAAIGFMGDDHLPRTRRWAQAYTEALEKLGTGVVYGDDGIQGQRLPTQWAMTSDIIREIGAMVPADVEHLYCDNAVMDLGAAAGCLQYLPDVLIEHMHPVAGKAAVDDGYARVNARGQYAKDRAAYEIWKVTKLPVQAAGVRALMRDGERRG
jgi:hypothetical protein